MARTFKTNSAGDHTNSALSKNLLDADYFNEVEEHISDIDDIQLSLIAFVQSLDAQIQFIDDPSDALNGVISTPLTVAVGVTVGGGAVEPYSLVSEVTVNILSDSTAGSTGTIEGGVIPIVVPLTNGVGSFEALATSAGDLTLSLTDSGGSGLDVNDQVTITWA